MMLFFFSPCGSRNYLVNRCQGWKPDSGHREQLTRGSLTGQLRLLPNEKAQTSLGIFQDYFFPYKQIKLGIGKHLHR